MFQSNNIDLTDFISQCKVRLKGIFDRLEWSEQATLKSFNTNSLASSRKTIIKKPSTPKAATYPDSCITENSLVLETPKLQEVLQNRDVEAPRNFNELQANFSREEKLQIYDHVIENTKKIKNHLVEQDGSGAEGEISIADIFAQKKRDEKRKKRKFRKSKPTHIEEVRCLVDLQMEALQQFMNNKVNSEKIIYLNKTSGSLSLREDNKRHYSDLKKREQDEKPSSERYTKTDEKNRSGRSSSKPYDRHKQHKRSSSEESKRKRNIQRSKNFKKQFDYERRRSRTHSKERREIIDSRSGSHSKETGHERKKRRSRSYERHSRKYKESSRETKNYRSRSRERYKRRQEVGYYDKYSSERKTDAYYDYSKQRYNKEEYYEKRAKSNESRNINPRSADEKYKIPYESKDKSTSHKISKHKKRKHEK